jgi:hypothetical protein
MPLCMARGLRARIAPTPFHMARPTKTTPSRRKLRFVLRGLSFGLDSVIRALQPSHAARCVACQGVGSHPVPVAFVGECSIVTGKTIRRLNRRLMAEEVICSRSPCGLACSASRVGQCFGMWSSQAPFCSASVLRFSS